MRCFVYRSARRPDTYVYVPREDDFSEIPESLLARLGPLERALEFDLTPERRLAQCNPHVVLAQLDEHGYFLQLPPGEWTST